MLAFTCERDTLIDIGPHVTIRVVSIGKETVEIEIDAPGDIHLEPDVIFTESKPRRGSYVGSFT